jgi:hypothetical protein
MPQRVLFRSLLPQAEIRPRRQKVIVVSSSRPALQNDFYFLLPLLYHIVVINATGLGKIAKNYLSDYPAFC